MPHDDDDTETSVFPVDAAKIEEIQTPEPNASDTSNHTCRDSFVSWLHSVTFKIYFSRTLSAWGDRMWGFGTGLFFIHLSPDSLQLTAIYGFVTRSSVLLFGAVIGSWIDKTPRMKAARISLVIQNVGIMFCAGLILILIYFPEKIRTVWGLDVAGQAFVIGLASVAALASLGSALCLEKDWIVVITSNDKEKLAVMNAAMRRIDLTTGILAPIAVGQIMTFAGVDIGCIFVAVWNFFSLFVEYFLLWKVYKMVPDLARKCTDDDDIPQGQTVSNKSCFYLIFSKFFILINGWQIYWKQTVLAAGIALACLYMTVLGFDSITNAYAYSQGISESVVSISFALGSIVGISSTFAFPLFYKRIGLERTCLIALFLEVSCLSLCVGSIWVPGSPFNIGHSKLKLEKVNTSIPTSSSDLSPSINITEQKSTTKTNSSDLSPLINTTEQKLPTETKYFSIALFLSGIVLARFGLWLADLSISQIFQERVLESERGVVNGVQSSLNMLMDMLKFGMVILAPEPETFGLLIIISFAFICFGYTSFAFYSYKMRGHLFHFEKICKVPLENENHSNNYTSAKDPDSSGVTS